MNAKKIIHKTEKLLKKTSIYSEQYYLLLNGVFEPRHTDMRENFEFTARGIRVYCFERGKLVFEGCASEAEAVFLAADSVIHQIALDIVIILIISCSARFVKGFFYLRAQRLYYSMA